MRLVPGTTRAAWAVVCVAVLSCGSAVRGDDWPGVLGPTRDGVSRESIGTEPRVVWRRPLGTGWSGPAVVGERVIVFHREGDRAVAEALRASDGEPVWRFEYPTAYRDSFGFDNGPRAVPTIDKASGAVYLYGAEGMLHCLDLETGAARWSIDTVREYGSDPNFFGRGSSPLVAGDVLVALIGGRGGAGVIGLDKRTGALIWKATDDESSYASPTLIELGGETRALVLTRTALVLLAPDDGRVLAEAPFRAAISSSVHAATPVVRGDEVFVSSCYGADASLFRVSADRIERIWHQDDALSNHYTNSVAVGGVLYGFHGRQDIPPPAELRAVDWATGRVLWSAQPLGVGALIAAGDRLAVLMETGDLLIVPASAEGYEPAARLKVLGFGIRAQPALSGGRLYARDTRELVCVSVGGGGG